MVVAQGLALATTEAALYLYQSAQSLWRAWQASAQLALEPHDAPLLHPTSLHTDPAAASASFQQKGLTSRAPMDLSSTSASLQKSPTHRAPSQLQTGQVSTQSDTTKPSGERAQPTTGVLSSACRQGLSLAGHQVCGLFERMESVVAVISQSTNPAEGITLLLPLGVLVVGGLAAAWARRGKPLPKLWLARTPLLFFVAGELGKMLGKFLDHPCLTNIYHGCSHSQNLLQHAQSLQIWHQPAAVFDDSVGSQILSLLSCQGDSLVLTAPDGAALLHYDPTKVLAKHAQTHYRILYGASCCM